MEYNKTKSARKQVITEGPQLKKTILDTLRVVSSIVGATLGPGGKSVLIERFEHGLPCFPTKDGVTVFRSLGFTDAASHCVMETARDSAIRTASEAGDGTTTATILSEAIVRNIFDFCDKNPRISPQRVVRMLEETFRDYIEPAIMGVKDKTGKVIESGLTRRLSLESEEDLRLLHSVARVSANGDTALADAVMECFQITGDDGNVTISESNGPSHYEVEKVEGFSIFMGYEESCVKFAPKFINDPGRQMTTMEKPVFVLYHGRITEIQTLAPLMEKVGKEWNDSNFKSPHNVVVAAIGFSETVLANLATNWGMEGTINVFPLLVPMSPQSNGQMQFLLDLQAVTGSKILDLLESPLETAELDVLGPGVDLFEATRFRSSIIGHADEGLLMIRIDELKKQLEAPESELDAIWLRERVAKLAGGIAKLRVIGASNGELKEKRDRAEDAVCAVRGAIKNGCLPGGAWTLLKLCNILPKNLIIDRVLRTSFLEPFNRLLQNCGYQQGEESRAVLEPILMGIQSGEPIVYDFLEHKHVNAYEAGILDSTPAVLEAIRTSLSISSQLGTNGGIIAFPRDPQLENQEARATQAFLRDANTNPADERW
jgi:chaperonin GroEL